MVFQVQIKYQKNSSTIQGIQVLLATLSATVQKMTTCNVVL